MRRAVSSWNRRPQESKYSCKYGVHTNYSMYDYQILHFCRHSMAWNAHGMHSKEPAQHRRMHPNRAGRLGDEADDAENRHRSMPELHSLPSLHPFWASPASSPPPPPAKNTNISSIQAKHSHTQQTVPLAHDHPTDARHTEQSKLTARLSPACLSPLSPLHVPKQHKYHKTHNHLITHAQTIKLTHKHDRARPPARRRTPFH
jgi:hypothetical protein